MGFTKWVIAPSPPLSLLNSFPSIPPLVVKILYNRGARTPSQIEAFLRGGEEPFNPFKMKDMDKAVTRIRRAIKGREPIAIYGDFDVDGLAATAILLETIRALGGNVIPYIPDRLYEGYGLNKPALRSLARKGIRLVITADCGIRSIEEARYARQIGLDLIITDHHAIGPEIPPALAVINPKRADCLYPFKELAGAGVAFKLSQALFLANRQVPISPLPVEEPELYDLVALGTVADVVPLTGENRTLAVRGIQSLNSVARPGLRALMQVAGVAPGEIDSYAISFILGPRLNAPGRLTTAMLSLDLLTSQDEAKALELARELDRWNRQRQKLMNEHLEKARFKALELLERDLVLIVGDESFAPGVVGLVASKLVEEFYRPAVVMELSPERSRGSARSIPEFDITAALDQCADLLQKYGGHAAAAGLTLETRNLPALKVRLEEIARENLKGMELVPTLKIDAETSLDQITPELCHYISMLEPFGYANPEPLFLTRRVKVQEYRLVGEESRHLRLTLAWASRTWAAIGFRMGLRAGEVREFLDIVYTPKLTRWGNQEGVELHLRDFRPSASSYR
ncbi:MAG: single-stranded-DNA-specific exonuclease RecJ [Anaerolineae bacterium]|nr:single-stranded-DNA-specific exonuclease RecJ [Anaerolineae bacterium]MDW8102613.1 single-stranded-DNA-specific exonuclease RecJ [Anaerolineae bacterium]